MRTVVKLTIIIVLLSFWVSPIFAQTPPPSSPASEAPLDILAGLLLTAGVIYGGVRFKNSASK
ncbi:MAG: hypothetical protein GC178_13300 [Flavobacteriales bacterium]|nr:hypothetical protein [Flavobacteriales bacterium]